MIKTISIMALSAISVCSCLGSAESGNINIKEEASIVESAKKGFNAIEVSQAFLSDSKLSKQMTGTLLVTGTIANISTVPMHPIEYRLDLDVNDSEIGVQCRLSKVGGYNKEVDLAKLKIGQKVKLQGDCMGVNYQGNVCIILCEVL